MRTYIVAGDIHISDQPPRGRTATYKADILAKLAWVVARANELEAAGLILSGDLLHRRNASHTSHRTVQEIRAVLAECNARVSVVVGNHDLGNGNTLDGQPILSVIDGVHVVRLNGASDFDSYIAGIDWQDAFEREGGAALFAELVRDVRRPIVVAHAPLTPHPYPFGPETAGWIEIAEVASEILGHGRGEVVRLIVHSHMHTGHDLIHYEIDGRPLTFSNPGALSRATVAADDVAREPSIAVIEYDTDTLAVSVEYVVVPHRPAAEVMRVEEHERDGDRDDAVQALARALQRSFAEVVDADTLRDLLRTLGRPENIEADVWTRGLALAEAALDGEVVLE